MNKLPLLVVACNFGAKPTGWGTPGLRNETQVTYTASHQPKATFGAVTILFLLFVNIAFDSFGMGNKLTVEEALLLPLTLTMLL